MIVQLTYNMKIHWKITRYIFTFTQEKIKSHAKQN